MSSVSSSRRACGYSLMCCLPLAYGRLEARLPSSLVPRSSVPATTRPFSSLMVALYCLGHLVRLCGGGCAYQATHWEHEVQIAGRRQREVRCDECCCST